MNVELIKIILAFISFLLLFGFILIPVIILRLVNNSNIKFKFVVYFIIGLIFTTVISLIFAWWTYKSDTILLKYYDGYVFNPDSNSYQVSYEEVLPENIDKVKSLEMSIMGIGWTLKAIFMFILFLPILIVIFFSNNLIDKIIKKINFKFQK